MTEENVEKIKSYGVRQVGKRGGSLCITLPSGATRDLELSEGDYIAFYREGNEKRLYIAKVLSFKTLDGKLITAQEIKANIEYIKKSK